MESSTCLWCRKPVDIAGATCDINCYAGLIAASINGSLHLTDEDHPPLDLYEQPWYEVERDGLSD